MKAARILLASLSLFATGISLAEAHAFLNDADPKVGAAVRVSPAVVKLWFTRHIKSVVSTAQVIDAGDREVDKRDAHVDPGDPTLLVVSVPRLGAGTYRVAWTAVCFDTHTTHGSFTFEVTGP